MRFPAAQQGEAGGSQAVLGQNLRDAGESGLIAPAGLMWSVVVESPTDTRQRAPSIDSIGFGSGDMSTKNGGSWT